MESILTAMHDLLENSSCLVCTNNVGCACPVAIHNLFPWDRCGCKPRAALNPATFCSLVNHQWELPGDSRNAPTPRRGHAETCFTGTETFVSGLVLGKMSILMEPVGRSPDLHHLVRWKMCAFKCLLGESGEKLLEQVLLP